MRAVSSRGGAGPSSRYEIIVGTTLSQVQCVLAACAQKRAAEKRGGIARLPPCASGASMVTANALM